MREPVLRKGARKREVHFNPYRTTTHEGLLQASRKATDSLFAAQGHRTRQPSKATVESALAITEAIFANLAHLEALEGAGHAIIISLAKPRGATSRYDMSGFGMLPQVVEGLASTGWLRLKKAGHKRGRASTVKAGRKLTQVLDTKRPAPLDFRLGEAEETVILSRTSWGWKAGPDGDASFGKQSDRVDYPDTATTRAIRRQLKAINQWLAQADIQWTGRRQGVDLGARRLRRHFTLPREVMTAKGFGWNSGGRLFGGFWQTLKASERRHLRIDGEPIADLDYASMFVRLALAKDLPRGLDPYAIKGVPREAIKTTIHMLLNAKRPKLPADIKAVLPRGWGMKELKEAIADHVPDLEQHFGTGIGLGLMHTESNMLLAVLEDCMAAGITALPMHDGVMVRASRAAKVRAIMLRQGRTLAALELPVKVKTGDD